MSELKVDTITPVSGTVVSVPAVYFYAYLSSNQAMADNTWTKAASNTVVLQTGSTYDNATNYRWTPAVAGTYFISGQVELDFVGTDSYILSSHASIYKNGSAEITLQLWQGPVSTTRTVGGTVSGIIVMTDSDYVELWGKTDMYSGSGRFNSGTQATHFMGYRLLD
tara:strand:- start:1129 stop:1626 length:498 start_codon:yes stop_codon:yes gene_type:complete